MTYVTSGLDWLISKAFGTKTKEQAIGESDITRYIAYNAPYVGDTLRGLDDMRYWQDYERNTGFKPRYEGRVYSGALNASLNEGLRYGNEHDWWSL